MTALLDGTTPVIICDGCQTKVSGGRATPFLLRVQLSRLGWSFHLGENFGRYDHCSQCTFEAMYTADRVGTMKGGD